MAAPCHGDPVRHVSVLAEPLRRWRLSGADFQARDEENRSEVNVEIVKRSDTTKKFVVLPKRWIVERTFAWLGRCRRLAKDWENLNQKALAFLRLASIRLMLRKLCIHALMFRTDLSSENRACWERWQCSQPPQSALTSSRQSPATAT